LIDSPGMTPTARRKQSRPDEPRPHACRPCFFQDHFWQARVVPLADAFRKRGVASRPRGRAHELDQTRNKPRAGPSLGPPPSPCRPPTESGRLFGTSTAIPRTTCLPCRGTNFTYKEPAGRNNSRPPGDGIGQFPRSSCRETHGSLAVSRTGARCAVNRAVAVGVGPSPPACRQSARMDGALPQTSRARFKITPSIILLVPPPEFSFPR